MARPVVAIVGDDPAIGDLVRRSNLTVDPEFVSVDSSEAELDGLHKEIVDAAGEDFAIGSIELAGVETDIINNRVEIIAVKATASQLGELTTTFGHDVASSSVSARTIGDACTNANCPNPLKAGLKLYRNSSYACMGGFVFRYPGNSTYYLSTAGHCSSIGDTYQHPSGTNRGSVSHQGWANNSAADVSLFPISSGQKSNQICVDPQCVIVTATSREAPASGEEVIGEFACATKQTATNCGTLVSVNNTISICKPGAGGCKTILWLRRATFTVVPGDSGGAVYASHKAMGIISATYPGSTNAVYSHVINVEFRFGMVVQLTP